MGTGKQFSKTAIVAYADGSVPYITWDDTNKTLVNMTGENACKEYTDVESNTIDNITFNDGVWYVVNDSVTIDKRITVTGTVHLILCDGATLTASKGITVTGENTLNIYGQSGGTVALEANAVVRCAGIGGGYKWIGGDVTIKGGTVIATGGDSGMGIGGGSGSDGTVNGTITLGSYMKLYGGTSANPTGNITRTNSD